MNVMKNDRILQVLDDVYKICQLAKGNTFDIGAIVSLKHSKILLMRNNKGI